MDTKQAKFDLADVTASVRHHHTKVGWRHKSHVNNQKAALQPPFLSCSAAREMGSVRTLQDDFKNQQKAKKEEKTGFQFLASPPPDSGGVRDHGGSCKGFVFHLE